MINWFDAANIVKIIVTTKKNVLFLHFNTQIRR